MKLKIVAVAIMAVYISIFLHEFGHYLALRYNGTEVEKISIGAVWKLKLTVFTDSRGTEYEIGPLPLWGYTRSNALNDDTSFTEIAEISLAGITFNASIILLLTPFYFLLRRRWREKGLDILNNFPVKIFKIIIVLNFMLLVFNALWLAPYIDGGKIVHYILSQWLGKTTADTLGFALGICSLLLLFYGYEAMERKIYKIYGWKHRSDRWKNKRR